jgi:hypothetical protein
MYAESLDGGSLAGGSLARKTEKGTKRTHKVREGAAAARVGRGLGGGSGGAEC